jgi:hypothetical protein
VAIQKNFKIANGLEVNDNLIFADKEQNTVGIGTTVTQEKLQVIGGIGATDLVLSGVGTIPVLKSTDALISNGYINVGVITSLTGTAATITSPAGSVKIGTGTTALVVEGDTIITGIVTATTFSGDISLSNGSESAPSIKFSSSSTTGIYSPGTNQFGIATNGVARITIDASGNVVIANTLQVPLGSASAPSLFFDGGTGIYSPGADQVAVATNGTQRLTTDTAAVTSTLPVVHPLGAAATPSLTFTGDLNTGIYSPGADQVAVATNGVGRLFVDASGNVAIIQSPTTVPSYTKNFNVSGLNASIALRANSAGTYSDQGIFFAVDGVNYSQIYNDGIGQLIFRTGSSLTERLRITSAGLVGIGTSAPGQALDVKGSVRSSIGTGTGAGGAGYALYQFGTSATATENWHIGAEGDGSFRFYNQGIGAGLERLRITSAGLMGLGTSAPQKLLEVAGPVRLSSDSNSLLELGRFSSGYGGAAISCLDSTFLRFQFAGTDRMTLTSAGSLGIGTTSPATLLHLRATGTPILRIQDDDGTGQYSDFYNSSGQSIYNAVNGAGVRGAHIFLQAGDEAARIDSSGRLLVGTSSSVFGSIVQAASTGGAQYEGSRFSADSFGPALTLIKSRGASVGTNTAVQLDDVLGLIAFRGANGTDYSNVGAQIVAAVDAEPFTAGDTTDLPTRLVFSTTADGASSPTERMRITSAGLLGLGTSAPGALLHVGGNTDDNVQAILAQGSDSNFRLVSINKSAANISGSEVARFGIRYATGTSDSSGIQFFRGNTAAEGNLGLYTGGTTRLYVQGATGNVGIGTTSPASKLSVSDSSSVQIQATTGTVDFRIQSIDANSAAFSGTVSNHNYAFTTNNSERARIDTSGRLLVGTSSATNNLRLNQSFAVVNAGGTGTYGGASLTNYGGTSADGACIFDFNRSRGSTDGSMTVVASGDVLGFLQFRGADGTNFVRAAQIAAEVDGTPGPNDMPGRLVFSTTADGASSPTERMRITRAGFMGLGTSSPGAPLDVIAARGNLVRFQESSSPFNGLVFQTDSTGATIKSNASAGYLAFNTGNSESARIDSSGRLLVGTSTARSNFFNITNWTPSLQLEGTNDQTSTLSLTANKNNSESPVIILAKTRGTTIGSDGLVSSGDRMGYIGFMGNDGGENVLGASIDASVDGTPGANDMPGRLVFSTTADGASSPTERLRIDSSGRLLVGTSSAIANTSTALIQSNSQIIAPQGVLTANGGWSMMPTSKVTYTVAADFITGHTVAIDVTTILSNSNMCTLMVSFCMNRGNTDAVYSQVSQYLGQWIVAQATSGLQAVSKADIVTENVTVTSFAISSGVVTLTFNTPNVRNFKSRAVQYHTSAGLYPAA